MDAIRVAPLEIVLRFFLAALFSGIIGYDREFKNRPAGLRTHILVCIGAALLALIQLQIQVDVLLFSIRSPELKDLMRVDPSRLIAQIVSGIGFLGAGTIIVTKRSVIGLTTAASLWAVAGLGIAVGLGYYTLAIIGFLSILIVLTLAQKLITIPIIKSLEIQFAHSNETKTFISDYFATNKIVVKDTDYYLEFSGDTHIYTDVYLIELPPHTPLSSIVEDLSVNKDILKIRVLTR